MELKLLFISLRFWLNQERMPYQQYVKENNKYKWNDYAFIKYMFLTKAIH